MAKSYKLSSIGGLAVAGAALGLYLGSSAISEINPAYYSTPSSGSRFHADLVPNPLDRDSGQPLPELAQVVAQAPGECLLCGPDDNGGDMFAYGPADSYGSYKPVAAGVVLAEAEEYVSQGLNSREVQDIDRYAHFPVSQDEKGPALAVKAEPENSECATSGTCQEDAASGS